MELEGKVAIVTGGAMGIGRASAEALARAGAAVVIGDIDAAAGGAVAAALGARAAFLPADVRRLADLEALAQLAEARFGGLDILVNNAAVAGRGAVDETDEAAFRAVLDTNLTSVWRGMHVAVPRMRRRGSGSIVNLSSVQAQRGFHGWAAYAAAKGGIDALTRQAAVDLAPAGIRVNAVAPGTILTPFNTRLFEAEPDGGAALREGWNRVHPLGRFGEAAEVAEAVLWLASPRASFVTGEVVRVDGGLAIRGD